MQHINLKEQFKKLADKFQFEVLEEIKFSDWNEIYLIEQNCMIQYDSINNGWNARINKQDIHI